MTKKAAHHRSREETVAELLEQLNALDALAAEFGQKGNLWAAKLMATAIYVICHDGRGQSVSLLTQLGVRERLICRSTAFPPVPGNLVTLAHLLALRCEEGNWSQVPHIVSGSRDHFHVLPFEDWWNEVIFSGGSQSPMTRKDLILAIRNKDGGGHFDKSLESESYVILRSGAGWRRMHEEKELEPEPTHLWSAWTIGWEIFTSLMGDDRQLRLPEASECEPRPLRCLSHKR